MAVELTGDAGGEEVAACSLGRQEVFERRAILGRSPAEHVGIRQGNGTPTGEKRQGVIRVEEGVLGHVRPFSGQQALGREVVLVDHGEEVANARRGKFLDHLSKRTGQAQEGSGPQVLPGGRAD